MADVLPPSGTIGAPAAAQPAISPPDTLDTAGQDYQKKIVSARQQGLTWEQVQQFQTQDWLAAQKAGLSNDQIAKGMGMAPGSTQVQQIIDRTQAHAVTHPDSVATIDMRGDPSQAGMSSGDNPVAKLMDFYAKEYQEDFKAEQANTTAQFQGANDFAKTNLTGTQTFGLDNIANQINEVTQLAGAAFSWVGSTYGLSAAIDTIAGRTVESASSHVPGPETSPFDVKTPVGTYHYLGTSGNLDLPRNIVSTYAQTVMPFLHVPGVPAALREEYVASGLGPEDFRNRQAAALSQSGVASKTAAANLAALQSFPKPEDFTDAAISLASQSAEPDHVLAVRTALQKHFVDTQESPAAAAARAARDPVFHQQLLSGALDQSSPPAGSFRTSLMGGASEQTTGRMGGQAGDITETGTTVPPNIVIPKAPPSTSPAWTQVGWANGHMPEEAGRAIAAWTGSTSIGGEAQSPGGAQLEDAFSPNPSSAGATIKAQLEGAVGPIRDKLAEENGGPVLTLYRPKGKTGNVTSFTTNRSLATELAGDDPGNLVVQRVPIGDVVWATDRQGHGEIMVHTGDGGVPASLSEKAPPTDVLAHDDSGQVIPKPRVGAKPIDPSLHPLAILQQVRTATADTLSSWLGNSRIIISGGARTAGENMGIPGASRTSEHLSNAAWDFHVEGRSNEEAGLALAQHLRQQGIPFDQVEITPSHVHIGFKPDGVGNRSEIIYLGMRPGPDAHGIALSGNPKALAEGELKPPEPASAIPEETPNTGLAAVKVPAPEEAEVSSKAAAPVPAPVVPMKNIAGGGVFDFDTAMANVGKIIAPVDKAVSWVRQLPDLVTAMYREVLNPSHPTQVLLRAMQENGSVPDASNPEFLQRIAEYSPDKAKYVLERNMTNLDGDIVGPGFKRILYRVDALSGTDFERYAVAKWALMMAEKGKETPVNFFDAKGIVEHFERGGKVIPVTTPEQAAAKYGVGIQIHPEKSALMRKIGPHYNIATQTVHLSDLADPLVEAKYGKGLTSELVKAHEMGHAIAHAWGKQIGAGDWSHLSPEDLSHLEDELNVVSKQFKPGMWKDLSQRSHVTKPAEVIADGIATWLTDPTARFRMPELYKQLGPKLEELGSVPAEWGTPHQQAFAELVHFQNQSLAWLRDSGLISRGSYVDWVADNESRIPGYRVQDTETTPGLAPRGITAYNPIKTARGSDLNLKNILQSVMRDIYQRRILADRNIATRATIDGASSVGFMEKVSQDKLLKVRLTPGELASLNADPNLDATFARMVGSDLKDGEVPVYRNGQFEKWTASEGVGKDLVQQLRGLDTQTMSAWQKIVSPVSSMLRKSVVLNPLFPLKILNYDITMQALTNPDVRNSVTQMVMGMQHVFGNTAGLDEAMRKGLIDHTFDGLSREPYIQSVMKGQSDPGFLSSVWNVARTPFEKLSQYGRAMNKVMPTGRYLQSSDAERLGTPNQVAYQTSEAPFHRAGQGGSVGKNINAVQPFFLAHLIGLEKTLRAAIGVPKPGLPKVSPKQFYGGLAVVAAATLTNYGLNKDKEWYKALPNWQKDSMLWTHVGDDWEHTGKMDEAGNEIMIPHGVTFPFWFWPPLISILGSALPRRLAAATVGQDPHAMDGIGESVAAGLSPPGATVAASVATPFLEQWMNRSFVTGRPLISDEEKEAMGNDASAQYTPYTTATAKVIGHYLGPVANATGWSPAVIDNYIKDWTGPWGQAALKSVDMIGQATGIKTPGFSGPDKTPAMGLADWPLLGSWMTRTPGASEQPYNDWRTVEAHIESVHATLEQAIKEDDFPKFSAILARNPAASVSKPFSIHGVAPPANEQQYETALEDAQAKAASDGKLMSYMEVRQALMAENQFKQFVWSLPVHNQHPDGDDNSIDPNAVTSQELQQRGWISAKDKSQLLSRIYSTLQGASEEAVKRADTAGIR